MTTWFTADQHFGHKNIIGYSGRPFADVEEMTEELVRRHNACVAPEDTTYHVGDFSLDERKVQPARCTSALFKPTMATASGICSRLTTTSSIFRLWILVLHARKENPSWKG